MKCDIARSEISVLHTLFVNLDELFKESGPVAQRRSGWVSAIEIMA
jgi:hypothetical protein